MALSGNVSNFFKEGAPRKCVVRSKINSRSMLRSTFGALLLGVSLLGVSEWEKLGTGSRLSPSRISSRPSINNNLPRSLSKTQLSSVDDWGGMQEKWAVVQIYDYRSDSVNAAAALLSTHEVSPLESSAGRYELRNQRSSSIPVDRRLPTIETSLISKPSLCRRRFES